MDGASTTCVTVFEKCQLCVLYVWERTLFPSSASKVIHSPLIFLLIVGEVLMYTIKKVVTEGRLKWIQLR